YTVTVADVNGCISASSSMTVTVNTAPAISGQPQSQTVLTGSTAAFSASATGAGLAYQWQVSTDSGSTWNNVTTGSGGTTSSYTTPATVAADSGKQYRVQVSGTCSPAATSSAATLTVGSQLAFTTQ